MADIAEKAEAETFLKSLLNKNLRIYTTDGRLFIGTFKCTDTVGSNLTYSIHHILYANIPVLI